MVAREEALTLKDIDCSAFDRLDTETLWWRYNELADTMTIYVTREPVSAVAFPIDSVAGCHILFDPTTLKAVGAKIEGFRRYFVPRRVRFMQLRKKIAGLFGLSAKPREQVEVEAGIDVFADICLPQGHAA